MFNLMKKRKQPDSSAWFEVKEKPVEVHWVTEKELREESPALQDLWDQYYMMLKLQAGDRKIGSPPPKRRTRPLPR